MKESINIFWFRRDLRLYDNAALNQSLKSDLPVLCVFIFDQFILDQLDNKEDARVTYIHNCISNISLELKAIGSGLLVKYGAVEKVWEELLKEYEVKNVFVNRDYEPYAINRDKKIFDLLNSKDVGFLDFKDQVIFEITDVLKEDGKPYTIYTPYKNKWKSKFKEDLTSPFEIELKNGKFVKMIFPDIITLEFMNFKSSKIIIPEPDFSEIIWKDYLKNRDIPSLSSTTKLSVHLRFGTVSIRQVIRKANEESEGLLNEFIWREFFMQILWHFPRVVHSPFRKKYEGIVWRNNENEFKRWCDGNTGFPLVDAGMRELNATGLMHNRVRMVVASFLVKDLLIDWRWGETYFAEKLLDFDLSANNGNWQWAAGTGCDAAPYFRIFNPEAQMKKFDPDKKYILKWIPEYGTDQYVKPMIDHRMAKERTLQAYKTALEMYN